MPSRETNGFDPCVFPQENSCLPFLAMKTHAIFTLEMNERSGLSPASRTLHSSTVADSPTAASSERAREPIPALASRRLWANVAELDEARRENAPPRARLAAEQKPNDARPPDQETAGSRDRRRRLRGSAPVAAREKEDPSAALRTACEPAARQAKNPGSA